MKSMASSIQPTLAAASACHCARVIVRYQGGGATVAVTGMDTGTLLGCLRADPNRGGRLRGVRNEVADGADEQEGVDRLGDVRIEARCQGARLILGARVGAQRDRARGGVTEGAAQARDHREAVE